jgi:hypothetical protein
MERSIRTMSASPGLTKGLVRAAALAFMVVSFGLNFIGPIGLGLLGVSSLAITATTPAQASCLIGGQIRNDIPAGNDCLEAQRTGCVQRLLSPDQYTSCLQANKAANDSGKTCIIGGTIHNELNAQDCQEAKATGCVRRLLTDTQYRSCLAAQRH